MPTTHAASAGRQRPFIVAIGGGKGGIGKSLISSSLALTLSAKGHKVILFDADLGGANAHTCLGLAAPKTTVADFLAGRVPSLGDVASETGYPNLKLISGALDWMQAANPRPHEKARLGEALLSVPTDVLLIDLGAGTSLHTIDFFLLADRGIVALIPEPTAIENAYRFMKMACLRRLQAMDISPYARPLLMHAIEDDAHRGPKSPQELLDQIGRQDPVLKARLRQELDRHPMALVVNQIRTEQEMQLPNSVRTACRRFFGVYVDCAVGIPYDETAWQSVRRRRPVVLEQPHGGVASAIAKLVPMLDPRQVAYNERVAASTPKKVPAPPSDAVAPEPSPAEVSMPPDATPQGASAPPAADGSG